MLHRNQTLPESLIVHNVLRVDPENMGPINASIHIGVANRNNHDIVFKAILTHQEIIVSPTIH